MAPNSWLRLSLLLPLMFLVQQSAANAAPSLADAIKEVDAKYLEAPDVEGEDNAPKIEAGAAGRGGHHAQTAGDLAGRGQGGAQPYRKQERGRRDQLRAGGHDLRRRQGGREDRRREHRLRRAAGERANRRDRSRQSISGGRGFLPWPAMWARRSCSARVSRPGT